MTDSNLGRLVGVLVAPERTFRSIRERPTWIAPLAVLLVLAVGLGFATNARTDFREVTERTFEARNMDLPEDRLDEVVAQQERFAGIGVWLSPMFVTLAFALAALYFWVGLKLVGSELTFHQSFATYLHGALPTAVMMLLAIPVVLAGVTLSYAELTTRSFLASNLAFLAPEGELMVRALLAGVDFFVLWSTVLLAIGYRVVGRVSRTSAVTLVAIFFLLGLGFRMLAAWVGGGAS